MNEPLPLLMENSIQIAGDYLEAIGELGDGHVAARFLTGFVEMTIRRGEGETCCSRTGRSTPT